MRSRMKAQYGFIPSTIVDKFSSGNLLSLWFVRFSVKLSEQIMLSFLEFEVKLLQLIDDVVRKVMMV